MSQRLTLAVLFFAAGLLTVAQTNPLVVKGVAYNRVPAVSFEVYPTNAGTLTLTAVFAHLPHSFTNRPRVIIQRTPALTAPTWSPIATQAVAGWTQLFVFDAAGTNLPAAYYRATLEP